MIINTYFLVLITYNDDTTFGYTSYQNAEFFGILYIELIWGAKLWGAKLTGGGGNYVTKIEIVPNFAPHKFAT